MFVSAFLSSQAIPSADPAHIQRGGRHGSALGCCRMKVSRRTKRQCSVPERQSCTPRTLSLYPSAPSHPHGAFVFCVRGSTPKKENLAKELHFKSGCLNGRPAAGIHLWTLVLVPNWKEGRKERQVCKSLPLNLAFWSDNHVFFVVVVDPEPALLPLLNFLLYSVFNHSSNFLSLWLILLCFLFLMYSSCCLFIIKKIIIMIRYVTCSFFRQVLPPLHHFVY